MSLYFPPNQPDGTEYEAFNGVVYVYDANRDTWTAKGGSGGGGGIEEAPVDGEGYVRKDADWEELGNFGPSEVLPDASDIVIVPSVPGSGTSTDPFVLSAAEDNFGDNVYSLETVTIANQKAGNHVVWHDEAAAGQNGIRFTQPMGIVDQSGEWHGKISFSDIPPSTSRTSYTARLRIGSSSVYFSWQVTMVPNGVIDKPSVTKPDDGAGGGGVRTLETDTITAVAGAGSYICETDTIQNVLEIDTSSYEYKAHSQSVALNTLTWDTADLGPETVTSGDQPATGWSTSYWAFIKFDGPAKVNWGIPASGSVKTVSYFYSNDGVNWTFDSSYNQSAGNFAGPFADSINPAVYWAMSYNSGTDNPLGVSSVPTAGITPDNWYQYTIPDADLILSFSTDKDFDCFEPGDVVQAKYSPSSTAGWGPYKEGGPSGGEMIFSPPISLTEGKFWLDEQFYVNTEWEIEGSAGTLYEKFPENGNPSSLWKDVNGNFVLANHRGWAYFEYSGTISKLKFKVQNWDGFPVQFKGFSRSNPSGMEQLGVISPTPVYTEDYKDNAPATFNIRTKNGVTFELVCNNFENRSAFGIEELFGVGATTSTVSVVSTDLVNNTMTVDGGEWLGSDNSGTVGGDTEVTKTITWDSTLTFASNKDLDDLKVGEELHMNPESYQPVSDAIEGVSTVSDWNQNQTWSTDIGPGGSWDFTAFTAIFDGDESTGGNTTGSADPPNRTLTGFASYFPNGSGPYTVEFITPQGDLTCQVNNNAAVSPDGNTVWTEAGVVNQIDTITLKMTTGAAIQFNGLRVNGKFLVDSGVAGAPGETTLTLAGATDLAYFRPGDVVQGDAGLDQVWSDFLTVVATDTDVQSSFYPGYGSTNFFDGNTGTAHGDGICPDYQGSSALWLYKFAPGKDVEVSTFTVVTADAYDSTTYDIDFKLTNTPGSTVLPYTTAPGSSGNMQATVTFDPPQVINAQNPIYFGMRRADNGSFTWQYLSYSLLNGEQLVDSNVVSPNTVKVISTDDSVPSITVDGGKWDVSNQSQVWSDGTVTGDPPAGPWTNFFDGNLTTRVFAANINNAFTQLDLANAIDINGKTVEVYGKRSNGQTSTFLINNIDISSAVSPTVTWHNVTSLLPGQTSITTLKSQNGGDNTSDYFAIRVGGQILIDAVNDSQVWSDGATGDQYPSYPVTNGFDGDLSTWSYPLNTDASNLTISFTGVTGTTFEVFALSGAVGGTNYPQLEINTVGIGSVSSASGEWVDVSSICAGQLTSLSMTTSGIHHPGFKAIRVDGKLLVDAGTDRGLGDSEVTCQTLKKPEDWVVKRINATSVGLDHPAPDNTQVWVANDNGAGINFTAVGPSVIDNPLLTSEVELESTNFSTTPDNTDSLKNIVWELNGVEQSAGLRNPYKPTGLATDTQYTVRVKHQGNSLDDSKWSDSLTFTTGSTKNLQSYISTLLARIETLEGN